MSSRPVRELSPDELTAADAAARTRDRPLPRRTLAFAGIVVVILFLASAFTAGTWRHFFGAGGDAATVVVLALVLGFVPVSLLTFRRDAPALRLVYAASAVALGFLNFALVAAIACWAVSLAALLLHQPLDPRTTAAVCFGAAGLVTAYGLINASTLRITRVTVPLPNLPPDWSGRTIALVSDVHLGNIRRGRFVHRLVRRLNALQPDLVLVAGDMFDGTALEVAPALAPWENLAAPFGGYFVTGNHDEFSDRRRYLPTLSRVGLHVLDNEKIVVDGLQLVGVHDAEAAKPEIFRAVLRRAAIDRSTASILVAHQPAHLAIPEEAGVSLQVSGHTHRGQFWPWSMIVSRVHGRFAYGLNRTGGMRVLTSSGSGTWGPPLRVGTRAEIVLIRLAAGRS